MHVTQTPLDLCNSHFQVPGVTSISSAARHSRLLGASRICLRGLVLLPDRARGEAAAGGLRGQLLLQTPRRGALLQPRGLQFLRQCGTPPSVLRVVFKEGGKSPQNPPLKESNH